jgi:zinc and cadmium transporter
MNSLSNTAIVVLAVYCLLAFAAAFGGGVLPSLFKLTHTRLQVSVSYVAGLMLGLALLGLLPHAIEQLHSVQPGLAWMLAGFLMMFLLQRFLPFHHHDVTEGSPVEPCGHPHSLAERSARRLSWVGVAVGLSVHSLFDGLAMAAAVASGERSHGGALGLGAALAVILHKPFSALAITTLMAASGASRGAQRWMTAGFAMVTPVAAFLAYLGLASWAETHPAWLGAALAFCAGTFLCIACSDLLPELQFHSHDRVKLSVALLLGVATAWMIVWLAPGGHDHHGHHHHAWCRDAGGLVWVLTPG